MNHEQMLRRRIRCVTWLFIIGLVLSGVTAIPLDTEVGLLAQTVGVVNSRTRGSTDEPRPWLSEVQSAVRQTREEHPFLFYGTDWLAFGHFVVALAFVGALRDPVRNRWLFPFGMMACALVIPYALVFGAIRGIPWWWRFIDCSFGVLGFVPMGLGNKWARELETARFKKKSPPSEFPRSPPGC